MKAVNIEQDEKAISAVLYLCAYCNEHPNCKGCYLNFNHVCLLKWANPEEWGNSLTEVMERRKDDRRRIQRTNQKAFRDQRRTIQNGYGTEQIHSGNGEHA